VCDQGSQSSSTGGSPSRNGQTCRICCWFAASWPWVLSTPFGRPVEPEVTYVGRVPEPEPVDPIAEAHRQWKTRWPEHADHMAAVTSVMRVQQLLLARVEDTLKPYGLTFAAYEALQLLAFSRHGSLPMGKMGERLMVHPAAVTNAISRLEQRRLVERRMSPDDRRVVLATITPAGRDVALGATTALNQACFGRPSPRYGQDHGDAARRSGSSR
jgi:DNA-binding MarR family transcriptional regulator